MCGLALGKFFLEANEFVSKWTDTLIHPFHRIVDDRVMKMNLGSLEKNQWDRSTTHSLGWDKSTKFYKYLAGWSLFLTISSNFRRSSGCQDVKEGKWDLPLWGRDVHCFFFLWPDTTLLPHCSVSMPASSLRFCQSGIQEKCVVWRVIVAGSPTCQRKQPTQSLKLESVAFSLLFFFSFLSPLSNHQIPRQFFPFFFSQFHWRDDDSKPRSPRMASGASRRTMGRPATPRCAKKIWPQ